MVNGKESVVFQIPNGKKKNQENSKKKNQKKKQKNKKVRGGFCQDSRGRRVENCIFAAF
jgi:hypothetical protein